MITSLIKRNFLLKQFQKEQIFMRWVLLNIVTLEIQTPVHSNCVSKFYQQKPFILESKMGELNQNKKSK